MKTAGTATQNIIAAGNYLKIELWKITLVSGTSYYFTAGDAPITVGGNTYVTGLVFQRDKITQKRGFQVGSMDLLVSPNLDNPGGQPQIAGGNFLSQCRAGVFDNSVWTLSKGFFAMPAPGHQLDTSPGLVPWWQGLTNSIQCGRFSADIVLDEATAILANQQMPRNMIQAGCVHKFCDAGCTLLTTYNTYSSTINGAIGGNTFTTNLAAATYADHFFDRGILSFTSGVLNGAQFTVQGSSHASTLVTLTTILPFPSAPSAGDSFTVLAGCDKQFATCKSGKFKNSGGSVDNSIHYRGAPFVPNPETLYDGGTGSQTYTSIGSQGKPGAGSGFTGKR